MTTMTEIRDYAAKIAERFQPEKIILFGSFANGSPTEDSDVDLFVMMDFEGKSYEKATEMRTTFRPPFALDLLVRNNFHLERRLREDDPFFMDIVNRGIILYEGSY